jgi:hypothetical protein
LGGDCEQTKAECLAEDRGEPNSEDCSADAIPTCENVTVHEYFACSGAQIEEGIAYFKTLTCETDFASIPEDAPTPPECVSVYEKCPELNPNDGDDDG